MTQDKILILDFGSQVTQLIARRVREAHVYCELHSFDMPLEEIKAFNPKASSSPAALIPFTNPIISRYRYFDLGYSGFGHLLRHAIYGAPLGRRS